MTLQELLSDLETRLYAERWTGVQADRPIFITSLPRAGTTVLLEALHRLPTLASHTYRDMPFVLTPVLWDHLSSTFRRGGVARERAHGDGMIVSEDSPEALEEALWKKAYPGKYFGKSIDLWSTSDVTEEFSTGFHDHMRKIIALRQPDHPQDGRYLSKNNANIARIDALRSMFPSATFIVPVRKPVEHAISMWRQHQNFESQHAKDSFVREYMEDLGHHEFGALHQPFTFGRSSMTINSAGPHSPDYWLAYWISVFEYLAERQDLAFVGFERLCSSGVKGIGTIAKHLNIQCTGDQITRAASILREAPPDRGDKYSLDSELRERAIALHSKLMTRCLLGHRGA